MFLNIVHKESSGNHEIKYINMEQCNDKLHIIFSRPKTILELNIKDNLLQILLHIHLESHFQDLHVIIGVEQSVVEFLSFPPSYLDSLLWLLELPLLVLGHDLLDLHLTELLFFVQL